MLGRGRAHRAAGSSASDKGPSGTGFGPLPLPNSRPVVPKREAARHQHARLPNQNSLALQGSGVGSRDVSHLRSRHIAHAVPRNAAACFSHTYVSASSPVKNHAVINGGDARSVDG